MSDEDDFRTAMDFLAEDTARNGNAVYAVYVAVIAAGAYGVPASQAFFRVLDPAWMAAHLSGPSAVLIGAAAVLAASAFAYRVGRIRGPVLPDLAYLDTVAVSPLDRSLVLRRWWRLSVMGCLVAGLLVGLVIGAGLAIAAVASPWVLVPGVLIGTVAGLVVAGSWLHGQVRTWPTGDRGASAFLRQRRSLRALHLTSLRTQSARSVTIGGAVLAGDLRAARLDVGPPSTRGRGLRLRPHGPLTTMALRDWLGWRRAPGTTVTGLALTGVAAYGLVRSTEPGTPSVVALGSLVLAYLGVSVGSEGLRLQGDNAGTPPLIGLTPTREAQAHLVVPAVAYLLILLAVGGVLLASGQTSPRGLVWAAVLLPILLVAQVMAAFRGLPPSGLFSPTGGVAVTALWYAVPLLVPVVCGTAATALLTAGKDSTAILVLFTTTYFAFLYARRRVRVLFEGHRD